MQPLPTSTSTTTTTTTTTAPTTTPPPTTTTAPVTTTAPSGPAGAPMRLRIPTIGVDASIDGVGLAGDGQMEIPPAEDVGWYELGPRPGAAGSSVLAAHVDYGGRRGAFFDLAKVPVGAPLEVTTSNGSQRFVVVTRKQIAKADIDLAEYFTADGPARLTLITCGGSFNRRIGHYQDNLVITAEPAP